MYNDYYTLQPSIQFDYSIRDSSKSIKGVLQSIKTGEFITYDSSSTIRLWSTKKVIKFLKLDVDVKVHKFVGLYALDNCDSIAVAFTSKDLNDKFFELRLVSLKMQPIQKIRLPFEIIDKLVLNNIQTTFLLLDTFNKLHVLHIQYLDSQNENKSTIQLTKEKIPGMYLNLPLKEKEYIHLHKTQTLDFKLVVVKDLQFINQQIIMVINDTSIAFYGRKFAAPVDNTSGLPSLEYKSIYDHFEWINDVIIPINQPFKHVTTMKYLEDGIAGLGFDDGSVILIKFENLSELTQKFETKLPPKPKVKLSQRNKPTEVQEVVEVPFVIKVISLCEFTAHAVDNEVLMQLINLSSSRRADNLLNPFVDSMTKKKSGVTNIIGCQWNQFYGGKAHLVELITIGSDGYVRHWAVRKRDPMSAEYEFEFEHRKRIALAQHAEKMLYIQQQMQPVESIDFIEHINTESNEHEVDNIEIKLIPCHADFLGEFRPAIEPPSHLRPGVNIAASFVSIESFGNLTNGVKPLHCILYEEQSVNFPVRRQILCATGGMVAFLNVFQPSRSLIQQKTEPFVMEKSFSSVDLMASVSIPKSPLSRNQSIRTFDPFTSNSLSRSASFTKKTRNEITSTLLGSLIISSCGGPVLHRGNDSVDSLSYGISNASIYSKKPFTEPSVIFLHADTVVIMSIPTKQKIQTLSNRFLLNDHELGIIGNSKHYSTNLVKGNISTDLMSSVEGKACLVYWCHFCEFILLGYSSGGVGVIHLYGSIATKNKNKPMFHYVPTIQKGIHSTDITTIITFQHKMIQKSKLSSVVTLVLIGDSAGILSLWQLFPIRSGNNNEDPVFISSNELYRSKIVKTQVCSLSRDRNEDKVIITASVDGSVKLWNISSEGKFLLMAHFETETRSVKLSYILSVPLVMKKREIQNIIKTDNQPVVQSHISMSFKKDSIHESNETIYELYCLVGFENGCIETWVTSTMKDRCSQIPEQVFLENKAKVVNLLIMPQLETSTRSVNPYEMDFMSWPENDFDVMVTYLDGVVTTLKLSIRCMLGRISYFQCSTESVNNVILNYTVPMEPIGNTNQSVNGSSRNECVECVFVTDLAAYEAIVTTANYLPTKWHNTLYPTVVDQNVHHPPTANNGNFNSERAFTPQINLLPDIVTRVEKKIEKRNQRELYNDSRTFSSSKALSPKNEFDYANFAKKFTDGLTEQDMDDLNIGEILREMTPNSRAMASRATNFDNLEADESNELLIKNENESNFTPRSADVSEASGGLQIKDNQSEVLDDNDMEERSTQGGSQSEATTSIVTHGSHSLINNGSRKPSIDIVIGLDTPFNEINRMGSGRISVGSEHSIKQSIKMASVQLTHHHHPQTHGNGVNMQQALSNELHFAKKDKKLLDLFIQNDQRAKDGTVSPEETVNMVYLWLNSKTIQKENIWELINLLDIDPNDRLKFVEVAKIAAVVSSALHEMISNEDETKKNPVRQLNHQNLKNYQKLKSSKRKVTYNSMGEKVFESVDLSKDMMGKIKGYVDVLRAEWNKLSCSVLSQSDLKALEPTPIYFKLKGLPECIENLFDKITLNMCTPLPLLWYPKNIHWFDPLRVIKICRTLMDMRSSKQLEVFNANSLKKIRPSDVDPIPNILLAYFEQNYGDLKLNVTGKKIINFLESCIQYDDYPIVNIMKRIVGIETKHLQKNLEELKSNRLSYKNHRLGEESSALWACVECRSILTSRGCVFQGKVITSDYSVNKSSPDHEVMEGSVNSVRYHLVTRADALACVDEILRMRGKYGPTFYGFVYQLISLIPAVYSNVYALHQENDTTTSQPVDNKESISINAENLIDLEKVLEIVYFEIKKVNKKILNWDTQLFGQQNLNNVMKVKSREINRESNYFSDEDEDGIGQYHEQNLSKIKFLIVKIMKLDPIRTGVMDQMLFETVVLNMGLQLFGTTDYNGNDTNAKDAQTFLNVCLKLLRGSKPDDGVSYIDLCGYLLSWEEQNAGGKEILFPILNTELMNIRRGLENSVVSTLLSYFGTIQGLDNLDPVWVMGKPSISRHTAPMGFTGSTVSSTINSDNLHLNNFQISKEGFWNPNTAAPSDEPGLLKVHSEYIHTRPEVEVSKPEKSIRNRVNDLTQTYHMDNRPLVLYSNRKNTTLFGEVSRSFIAGPRSLVPLFITTMDGKSANVLEFENNFSSMDNILTNRFMVESDQNRTSFSRAVRNFEPSIYENEYEESFENNLEKNSLLQLPIGLGSQYNELTQMNSVSSPSGHKVHLTFDRIVSELVGPVLVNSSQPSPSLSRIHSSRYSRPASSRMNNEDLTANRDDNLVENRTANETVVIYSQNVPNNLNRTSGGSSLLSSSYGILDEGKGDQDNMDQNLNEWTQQLSSVSKPLSAMSNEEINQQLALEEVERRRQSMKTREFELEYQMEFEREDFARRELARIKLRKKLRREMAMKERVANKKMEEATDERFIRSQKARGLSATDPSGEEDRLKKLELRRLKELEEKERAMMEKRLKMLQKSREKEELEKMRREEVQMRSYIKRLRDEAAMVDRSDKDELDLVIQESLNAAVPDLLLDPAVEVDVEEIVEYHEIEEEEVQEVEEEEVELIPEPLKTKNETVDMEVDEDIVEEDEEWSDDDDDDQSENEVKSLKHAESPLNLAQKRMLHFMKRMRICDSRNISHPRRKLGKDGEFYIPLVFSEDIHFDAFKVPCEIEYHNERNKLFLDEDNKEDNGFEEEPSSYDGHDQEESDCEFVPNNYDPFHDIQEAIVENKIKLELNRLSLYTTSLNEIPASDWIQLVKKGFIDWNHFFTNEKIKFNNVTNNHEIDMSSEEIRTQKYLDVNEFKIQEDIIYPLELGGSRQNITIDALHYKYYKITLQEKYVIFSIDIISLLKKSTINMYLSRGVKPNMIQYDYKVICNEESNNRGRMTIMPDRPGVYYLALYAPKLVGVQCELWANGTKDMMKENPIMMRVDKIIKKFNLLTQLDVKELAIHFPRLEKEAKIQVDDEMKGEQQEVIDKHFEIMEESGLKVIRDDDVEERIETVDPVEDGSEMEERDLFDTERVHIANKEMGRSFSNEDSSMKITAGMLLSNQTALPSTSLVKNKKLHKKKDPLVILNPKPICYKLSK